MSKPSAQKQLRGKQNKIRRIEKELVKNPSNTYAKETLDKLKK